MLTATQLVGFGVGGASDAPAGAAAASVTDNASTTGSAATYTFTSRSFGAEAGDRYIVVGTTGNTGTATTVSSMTIGGVSAAALLSVSLTNNALEFWIAAVPTGTTGTVAVTWGANRTRCAIVVWRVVGLVSSALDDSAQETGFGSSAGNGNIDIAAGGVALGMTSDTGTSSRTWTWSGLTESVDATYGSGRSYSAATGNFASAQTDLAVSATPSGNTSVGIFAAVALRQHHKWDSCCRPPRSRGSRAFIRTSSVW
jgi:hypothetical protein